EGYNSVAIGTNAAQNATTAFENVSLGFAATRNMTTGSDNVAIGFAALENNEEGGANTAIGSGAGKGENTHSKSKNVLIGYNTGTKLEAGNNTMLGYEAGFNTVSGTDNVFLGYQAGYNETESNKLYISNSNTSTPLLYGDFSTNFLQINGTLNINDAFALPSTDGDSAQVLTTDGSGIVTWVDTQGDHLGDHIATQNLQLTDFWLSNDGDDEGININNDGQVGIGNLNIGSESNDQSTSNQSGNGFTTTPWLYTNAIEAQGERGGSSTLITVGNDGTYGGSDEIHLVTDGTSHLNINSSGEIAVTSGELMTYSSNGSSQVELTNNNNNSGRIILYNASSEAKVSIFVNGSNNVGAATFSGPNASNIILGFLSNYPDHGYVAVKDASGDNQAGIFVNSSGEGIVFGDTKNFRMDHPKDKSKEIWYASLEGPEAAAYIRGTGTLENGVAVIEFPEHFALVANPETMTIQLTPNSIESRGLAVTNRNSKGFEVGELMQGKGTYTFDWTATAVRKGYEQYEAVREKVDLSVKGNKE
ncbi:MAG: hypothetical protein AAF847_13935, partial [Bacteroidota bacterium]